MRRPALLLALIAALLAGTVALSATWVMRAARNSMIDQVQATESLAASERAATLGYVLDDAAERLRVNVNSPLVVGAIEASHGALLQPGLDNALALPAVRGITITDQAGVVLGAAGTSSPHVGRAGHSFRSSPDRRNADVVISVEIRAADGSVVGWADETLDLDRLSPQLQHPFSDYRGVTSVVSRDGTIVMSTRASTATTVQSPAIRARLASGEPGFVRFHSDRLGADRLAAVHPVPGTDVAVIIGADAAAAYTPTDRITARLGSAFGLSMALASLLVGLGLIVIRSSRRRLELASLEAAALAHTDALTGVANRRAFDAAIEEVATSERPVGVILIDVDHLKAINDGRGHAVGDLAIRTTAEAIRGVVRSGDLVARIGGDEFAVILDGAPQARTTEVAGDIQRAVQRHGNSIDLPLSVSIGNACGVGGDASMLLLDADAELYAVKRARPGLVRVG